MSECSTSSTLSTALSVTFGCIYGLLLVGISAYSHQFLMQHDSAFMSSSCLTKFKFWILDVYKRRRCYLPIITHLADMITDVAVIVQFGELASHEIDGCGINMYYLFGLSIFVLLFYRGISSFLIYQSTKRCNRLLIQWLDFELFRALYINYLCDKKEPSSPQRWITSLEAAFESAPQALIQTIFLVKTGSFSANGIIVISLIFSLWSIISKIMSDDRVISISEAKHMQPSFKGIKTFSCISWSFLIRYLWRIFDVSSRILIASLLWIVLGGVQLSFIIAIEVVVTLVLCLCTKRWEFLLSVVAIVVSKSSKQTTMVTIILMIYRSVTNVIFIVVITNLIYTSNKGRCWKCTTYEMREQYQQPQSEIFVILIYCWFAVVITPILSTHLILHVFKGTKSNSRSIQDMINSEDWKGIIEMQPYRGHYGVYDNNTNQNLLMLAIHQNYGKLVHYLSVNDRVDMDHKSSDGRTLLDYIKFSVENENKNDVVTRKYFGELLVNIYIRGNLGSQMKANDGSSPAELACYIGDVDSFVRLVNLGNVINPELAWKHAVEGDHPEILEHLKKKHPVEVPNYAFTHSDFVKKMIVVRKPNILTYLIDQKSKIVTPKIWFYAVDNGDLPTIKTIRKYVADVNVRHEETGQTVLHLATLHHNQKDNQDSLNILNYLRKIVDRTIRDTAQGLMAIEYSNTTNYKIIVLGGGGSGKTTLIRRFVDQIDEKNTDAVENIIDTWEKTRQNYEPTIEDSFQKTVTIDGISCFLDIIDTPGQEEYETIQDLSIVEGQIFILVYSINNAVSFDTCSRMRGKIEKMRNEFSFPVVLVGNKCDLTKEREVSKEE
eukprot:354257_1